MALINAVKFSDVSFTFDHKRIINGFSDVISSGERVCFMGESGAGKSTLLSSLVGLTFPESGEIKVADLTVNAANIRQIRTLVAWLPQDVHLPYQTVLEMLQAPYGFAVNKHLQFEKEKCVALLHEIGLDGSILEKNLTAISGGEKQRLALVSALMLDRKILLLDEPTSALDNLNRNKLINLLNGLIDTTILAITHDEEFARSMNRVITLKKQ